MTPTLMPSGVTGPDALPQGIVTAEAAPKGAPLYEKPAKGKRWFAAARPYRLPEGNPAANTKTPCTAAGRFDWRGTQVPSDAETAKALPPYLLSSTCSNSSSTGVARPKIDTATLTRLLSKSSSSTMPLKLANGPSSTFTESPIS